MGNTLDDWSTCSHWRPSHHYIIIIISLVPFYFLRNFYSFLILCHKWDRRRVVLSSPSLSSSSSPTASSSSSSSSFSSFYFWRKLLYLCLGLHQNEKKETPNGIWYTSKSSTSLVGIALGDHRVSGGIVDHVVAFAQERREQWVIEHGGRQWHGRRGDEGEIRGGWFSFRHSATSKGLTSEATIFFPRSSLDAGRRWGQMQEPRDLDFFFLFFLAFGWLMA